MESSRTMPQLVLKLALLSVIVLSLEFFNFYAEIIIEAGIVLYECIVMGAIEIDPNFTGVG